MLEADACGLGKSRGEIVIFEENYNTQIDFLVFGTFFPEASYFLKRLAQSLRPFHTYFKHTTKASSEPLVFPRNPLSPSKEGKGF